MIIPIKFAIGYGFHVDLPLLLRILYWQFSSYGHVVLGVAAVISIRFIYRQCEIKCVEHPFFDWSDKYSYDVYLVHHVFVQSAWGCVEYISNRWLALPLAVFLTLIFSIVLNHFSCYVKSKLIVIFRKLLDC